MWKFKTSKYKNAAAKIQNKEEWITGVSAGNLSASSGNLIKASAAYVVFNTDTAGGSSLGLVPLGEKSRYNAGTLPTIQAHSDFVSDFDFSPFDDYLLATASQDCLVKIWHLPEAAPCVESVCNPAFTVTQEARRVDCVLWNPVVEGALALAVHQTVKVYDVVTQSCVNEVSEHADQVQGISWSPSGSLLAFTSKDKNLRVIDVRAGKIVQTAASHAGNRDSRVLWIGGGKDYLLTTGFNSTRQREVTLRDTRDLSRSLKTLSLDSSTGTLIPLYDVDTSMLFLAGKGDMSIRYLEVSDKDPFLIENSVETVEQIKGAGLVPKRALDVMSCEVDRLVVLTQQAVISVPYIVPRKSNRDFQEDLYPDTFSGEPVLSCQAWAQGQDATEGQKVSLNPVHKPRRVLRRPFGDSSPPTAPPSSDSSRWAHTSDLHSNVVDSSPRLGVTAASRPSPGAEPTSDLVADLAPDNRQGESPAGVVEGASVGGGRGEQMEAQIGDKMATSESSSRPSHADVNYPPVKDRKSLPVVRGVSKYRNVEGVLLHRSLHTENLRGLSQAVPGESDGFHANRRFCALPLGGPGGLVAVLRTDVPGRLPDTGVPALQNGSLVSDFAWDPFNDGRLVVGCDDAKIRVWDIPEDGLTETLSEPSFHLSGHTEKLYFVRFHPQASDILASGSYDMSVRIWSLASREQLIQLDGHSDTIFSFAWSGDGRRCATSCKDGQIRLYEPRQSTKPVATGAGLEGSRGGRVVWTCGDRIVVATGFDRASVRQVAAYDTSNPATPLVKVDLDTAPSVLMAHYDEDSSTLFVTGRGDALVKCYEVGVEAPHLSPLSDWKGEGRHQALAFLPRACIDVRSVEFARALRLTASSIEPVSFRVPRVRKEYFQDDLFRDTRVTWESALTGSEWLAGKDALQNTVSLKPDDMVALSAAPAEAAKQQKYESFSDYSAKYKTDAEKKDELVRAMTNKLNVNEGPLPQDLTEGVDPEEWVGSLF